MDLAQLQQLITEGAASNTANTVLNDRMAEAMALRGATPQAEAQTGYVDPLSLIATVVQNSKGRQQLAETRPKAEMALRRVNELGAAEQNYGLKLAAEKVRQEQANKDRVFGAGRTDAANAQANALQQMAGLAKYRENMQANADRTFGAGRNDLAVELAEQARQREQEQATQSRRQQFYHKETGEPKQLSENYLGELIDTNTGEAVNADLYTETDPAAVELARLKAGGKARSRGGKGKDVDPMALVADPDAMGRIITHPELGSVTGKLDPTRYLAEFGFAPAADDPEALEKRQALALDMKGAALNSVKSNLEGLGVNPTDKDLEIAFGDIPSQDASPRAWGLWAENKYRPALEKAFNRAIENGDALPEERDAYLKALEGDISENRRMWRGATGDTPNPKPKPKAGTMTTEKREALLKRKAELEAQMRGG